MRCAAIVGTLTLLVTAACGARTELHHLDASLPISDADVPAHDAGRDAPVDAGPPPVTSPDAGTTPVGCAAAGGVCVLGRWANCPPGRQPTEDLHADCVAAVSRGDFCCVPAPPSTAALSDAMIDCFPTRDCERCWAPIDDPAFTCAGGRVACAYDCLD